MWPNFKLEYLKLASIVYRVPNTCALKGVSKTCAITALKECVRCDIRYGLCIHSNCAWSRQCKSTATTKVVSYVQLAGSSSHHA